MRIIDGGYASDADRRGRPRVRLSWTIYLLRSTDACPLESKTINISSKGFYCLVPEEFVVGECIRGTLMIPSFDSQRPGDCIALECHVTVLRVDPIESSKYGLACHIDDYRIVAPTTRNGKRQSLTDGRGAAMASEPQP